MPRRVDTPAGAPRGLHGGPALMDRLQTHAWQLLALLLAALLVWQSLARLGAERDAAQARTDLATDRQAAATAALHASERYRQREGAYRERLDFLARDTDLFAPGLVGQGFLLDEK